MELNGGGGQGAGTQEAAPLTPQSLIDDGSVLAIQAWGPVVGTTSVLTGGGSVVVNQLASVDPFSKTWQLPDGRIIVTNEPISNFVNNLPEPNPVVVAWTGPDSVSYDIIQRRMNVWFKGVATQQDIQDIIDEHELKVIFSWFEPADGEGSGNAIATFEFEYPIGAFANFDAAYAYFSAHPLVSLAKPNIFDQYVGDYAAPNDPEYHSNLSQSHAALVNLFGLTSIPAVQYGPPSPGTTFSDQVVAVIDDGVYRNHKEFKISSTGLGDPPSLFDNGSKISWVGVNCGDKYYEMSDKAHYGGEPIKLQNSGRIGSHGTQVAGIITAKTNSAFGTASLAPRACVLPIRLNVVGYTTGADAPITTSSSLVKAVRALRFQFPHGYWDEWVRVVNMSISGSKGFGWWDPDKDMKTNLSRDLNLNDRLYVASAGNEHQHVRRYPAAYSNVLGVSGMWYRTDNGTWQETNGQGSNYFNDGYASYKVSGVYGLTSFWHKSPVPPFVFFSEGSDTFEFGATSCCAPQISSLAFHLFTIHPNPGVSPYIDYLDVWNRIKTKTIPGSGTASMAPVASFSSAITGW